MQLMTYLFVGRAENTDGIRDRHERPKYRRSQMVVASSHGDTALKAYALCAPAGIHLIAITIGHGWEHVGWCMSAEKKAELEALGIDVVVGIHGLGDSVGSAFTEKHGGRVPEEIVRDTLYRFSQGMKVAVEDIFMAAEAGLLDMSQEVVVGHRQRADTAIVQTGLCPHLL